MRMNLAARLVGALMLLAASGAHVEASSLTFSHGYNLTHAFSFGRPDPAHPGTFLWPPFHAEAAAIVPGRLQKLRNAGFDFMRLSVEPGPFLALDPSRREQLLRNLITFVKAYEEQGFAVIVDLHPGFSVKEFMPSAILDGETGPAFRAYTDLLVRLAKALSALSGTKVALELMNEPQRACVVTDGTDWQTFQRHLYRAVRQVAPTLPVFVTGGCWSQIKGLAVFDTAGLEEANTYLSVHFYDPFLFTHQGAHWSLPAMKVVAGISYPASAGSLENAYRLMDQATARLGRMPDADRAKIQSDARKLVDQYYKANTGKSVIEKQFAELENWARAHNWPNDRIVFTEIGALKQMDASGEYDKGSRLRWFQDTTAGIRARHWGWAVWSINPGWFSIYPDDKSDDPDPDVLRALGLHTAPNR
jgi:endoglucanase